jgi:FkbM family methyltransferase
MKDILKRLASRVGLYLASTERLGIDVELDLQRLTASSPLRTIFDVGANLGQTAAKLSTDFPAAQIYSFEPVPTSFAEMAATVATLPRVHAFNLAMGESRGTAHIHLTGHSGSNTLKQVAGSTGAVEVQVETIDAFCAAQGIASIDLLKIDVEGFELNVLSGARHMLETGAVRFVFAECVFTPNAEMPHTSFFALHERLTQLGFCFVGFYAESYYLHLGCAMGNVLYALQARLPASVPGKVLNIA